MNLTKITSTAIKNILARSQIDPFNFVALDSTYILPAKKWLENDFLNALKNNLYTLGLQKYISERWDCDDFAVLSFALARINHRLNGAEEDAGMAFGFLTYKPDRSQYQVFHAINFAISDNEEIIFIEPNGPRIVTLTENEKISVLDVII